MRKQIKGPEKDSNSCKQINYLCSAGSKSHGQSNKNYSTLKLLGKDNI